LRVLVVNKFWYRRAGLERVMFDEIAWLEAAGHEVAHFSTAHPKNDPSPWSGYFAPYLEIGVETTLTPVEKALAGTRMFWNGAAEHCFGWLLRDFRPDVVHMHGIHRQLSPSLLHAARRARVPVVQTLHDYHPICAAGDLLLGGQRACDPPRCGRINALPCVSNRCVQYSAGKSALAAAELLSRRWLLRLPSLVDAFISPSRYLAAAVRRGGLRRPLYVVPNAVPCPAISGDQPAGDYFVYAGRLSREKGLGTLVEAVRYTGVPLKVAGEGPLRERLERDLPPTVTLLGRVDGMDVDLLLAGCRGAVVPSEWAENAPMSVLEPMALARPVIASRMGGIPEQVRDGREGILVRPGDGRGLAAALRRLSDDAPLADRLGRAGRERVLGHFSPDQHTHRLLSVYRSTIAAAGAR
jgi:glycosyltransferase involved in cell wall biosynthesis